MSWAACARRRAPPQAYVFNATVVPPGSMGYLTLVAGRRDAAGGLDPERLRRLHHLEHGDRADHRRLDRRLRAGLTQLILDISGYFAP